MACWHGALATNLLRFYCKRRLRSLARSFIFIQRQCFIVLGTVTFARRIRVPLGFGLNHPTFFEIGSGRWEQDYGSGLEHLEHVEQILFWGANYARRCANSWYRGAKEHFPAGLIAKWGGSNRFECGFETVMAATAMPPIAWVLEGAFKWK